MSVGLSVLVLSLNEEQNIEPCLGSVGWCDDVVVLDSGSSDRTIERAQALGARVAERPFDDFASQRNFAMDNIPFRYPWVFHLDADERFTPRLEAACRAATAPDEHSGFFVPARVLFMGRPLRWAGLYPSYQLRLARLGELRFVQHGHGQREADAPRRLGYLREPYLHLPLSRGLEEWFARHNRYSSQECSEQLARPGRLHPADLLAGADPVRRRRALKALARRAPFRSSLRFTYMYFLRLGFLDGRAGLAFCRLMAVYEAMTELKLAEARWRRSL